MNESTLSSPAAARGRFASAVIRAGLVTGTLDGVAAIIQYTLKGRHDPEIIFKYIASALVGKGAFSGGWPMVAAGLLLHYFIALSFTVVFFYAYPRLSLLRANPLLIGVLYGIVVWSVMNLVVLPLSAVPPIPFQLGPASLAAGILIVAIGLPCAFLARRYYREI